MDQLLLRKAVQHPARVGAYECSGPDALGTGSGAFFLPVRMSYGLLLAVNDGKTARLGENRRLRSDRQKDQGGSEDFHFHLSAACSLECQLLIARDMRARRHS